jgi:hypothetical protein
VCEFLPVTWAAFVMPLCLPRRYRIDWMRPRITKSKLRGGFLGDEFAGRINNRAQWITQLARVFPVGVVNSPESLARLPCRNRFHGDSSPEIKCAKMYQLHMMRGQS